MSLLSSGFSDMTFESYNGFVEKDSQQKYLSKIFFFLEKELFVNFDKSREQ